MMRIRFAARDDGAPWGKVPPGAADAWLIGVRAGGLLACGPRSSSKAWRSLAKSLGIDGGPACVLAPAAPLGPIGACGWAGAFGLGKPAALTVAAAETVGRRIGAAAARPGVRRVFVDADAFPETAAAIAAGLVLRATPQLGLRGRPADPFADAAACPEEAVILTTNPGLAAAAWRRVSAGVEATLWARRLIAEPGNRLSPADLQAEAESLAPRGVRVSVLDDAALAAQGLNLIRAVGQGSAVPPRLIVLDWPGIDAKAKPLALIGKGITFDTGGISIKPAEKMEEMKGDMGGAAAVLGAVAAAAARQSPLRVVGLLAVAENAVGGNATRPGDVVKSFDGRTVEIVDTDAEGRLVLADAIAYAKKTYAPYLTVDLATLTGAIVRTLGVWRGGLFANADAVAARLLAAAETSGEALWRMPLPKTMDDDLDSDVADLRNCAFGLVPDALHAARFLEHFAEGMAWAHLDIAGVADAPADSPTERKGPRGYGVRLLDALIRDLEETPWTTP